MKRIGLLLITMILGFMAAQAQLTVTLSGNVLDNGQGVPGHPVSIFMYSGGFNFSDSTFTDSAGSYGFTITTPPGSTQGGIQVYTYDCNGNFLFDSAFFNPGNTNFTSNFNYCANGIICSNSFYYLPGIGTGVDFYASVTGQAPYTFAWDFGDGNTSSVGTPSHTYNAPGTYNVCLITTDNTGCMDTTCQTVAVAIAPPCNAQFIAFQTSSNQFDFFPDSISNINASFAWDFGDGNTSGLMHPTHAYNSPGLYLVCLTVVDTATNCTDTYCDSVFVSQGGPTICQAGFNVIGVQGNTIHFSNTSTGGTVFNPLTYHWDLGDGNTSTAQSPTHTYAMAGTYNVCLVIDDNLGCSDTLCSVITVTNPTPCSALFYSFPSSANSYTFYADSSFNSPFASYQWTFGDGSSGSGLYASHTYNASGLYLVCLTVSDSLNNCTDTYCDSVYVGNTAQCQAGFNVFLQGGLNAAFFNTSVGSNPTFPLTHQWTFGDGSTSTLANPSHTYASAGTYTVCLVISDNSGCTDSICQTITVINTGNNCQASFNSTVSGSVASFLADTTGNGPFAAYLWDFGNGSFGNGMSTTHTYNSNGIFPVCLTVIDSLNGCVAVYCDSVVIGNIPACTANFSYGITGAGVQFTDLSSGGFAYSYFWDFGDSTFSTLQNPLHAYAGSGPYFVCLTVTDTSNGCTDTYCDIITIQAPGTYSITGNAFADSNLIYNGTAYLIVHDTVAGTLTAIDTTSIAQSFYNFTNVNPGTYLVKAALNPTSPFYANYMPTYFGDVLTWNNATSTIVTNTNVFSPPIFLVQGNNPGGPGFVGGLISQGANKGPGDPLSDILVMILDSDGNPVAYAYTDANGEFSFGNLAYGTYQIMVEIPGKYTEIWTVTISADNPSFQKADFEVGDFQVTKVNTTSIDNFANGDILGIYPNPASNFVNVNLEFTQATDVKIELVNLVGQTLKQVSAENVMGNQTIELELGNVPQGVYLIKVEADKQIITNRIVKQ